MTIYVQGYFFIFPRNLPLLLKNKHSGKTQFKLQSKNEKNIEFVFIANTYFESPPKVILTTESKFEVGFHDFSRKIPVFSQF